jgi:hypothetical protein
MDLPPGARSTSPWPAIGAAGLPSPDSLGIITATFPLLVRVTGPEVARNE